MRQKFARFDFLLENFYYLKNIFKKSILFRIFFFLNFSKKSFKKIEGEGMRIAFKKSIL